MKDYLKKTHYESAYGFLSNMYNGDVFPKQIFNLGPDPTYAEFVETCLKSLSPTNNEADMANFMNIYFHLYHMKQCADKIYYVTPDLSARLAQTSINVDSYFLKSPFREIYVQIDPGLFYIHDIDGSKVSVEGFYVHFREYETYKHIRVMACSLLEPTANIPFNDANFYFRMEIPSGKLKDALKEHMENEVEKKKNFLKRSDIFKNIGYLEEFAAYIFNILLYITSKNPDLSVYKPVDFQQKIDRLRSASKKRKLEKRAQKASTHRIIVIGANVKDKNNDMEEIQKAGGIGNWKLSHKVRVSGHWRAQWYGSEKDNTRHAETIWIDDYEKGPEFSDIISPKFIVK